MNNSSDIIITSSANQKIRSFLLRLIVYNSYSLLRTINKIILPFYWFFRQCSLKLAVDYDFLNLATELLKIIKNKLVGAYQTDLMYQKLYSWFNHLLLIPPSAFCETITWIPILNNRHILLIIWKFKLGGNEEGSFKVTVM